jgi:exopolysaccharide production protein ExoZ
MILALQYVRGIAAMMVVYHHAGFQVLKASGEASLPFWQLGAAGVDLFFVISGFIIWLTTHSAPAAPAQFIYRRIVRVAPLYWLLTFVLLIVSLMMPQLLSTTEFNPWHAGMSLLFIPIEHPVLSGEVLPFFIQGWTLNYEMFFYAIFALAMQLTPALRATAILGILGFLALAGRIVHFENLQAKFYTSTIVLEFAFGVSIAVLYIQRKRMSALGAWMAAALGLLALLLAGMTGFAYGPSGFDSARTLVWGLPAAAIVFGVVTLDRAGRVSRFASLLRLGDSSYSLYLTHIFVLPLVVIGWRFLGVGFARFWLVAYAGLAMTACVAVGWLTYEVVERPLTRALGDLVRFERAASRALTVRGG